MCNGLQFNLENCGDFFIGKFILRIGGRKSISQMTITQTIVMVGIGSLLIQPIAEEDIWGTLLIAFIFTMLMVISEYLEIKFDMLESFFSGKAVIVIEDGEPNLNNLRKIRLTVDRLETRLRQNGVSSIKDVKTGTIEISGQLGYELKDDKKPLSFTLKKYLYSIHIYRPSTTESYKSSLIKSKKSTLSYISIAYFIYLSY